MARPSVQAMLSMPMADLSALAAKDMECLIEAFDDGDKMAIAGGAMLILMACEIPSHMRAMLVALRDEALKNAATRN